MADGKSIKVQAKLGTIEEGWHGVHHRRVARLEIQGKDSPFDGQASLLLDAAPFEKMEAGQLLELEIRPVEAVAAAPKAK